MADATDNFLIARNPDPDSTLPYLPRLPIDGGILLKARDRWPTTARVYCHPLDEWPADAEIVEQVAIRSCQRRGAAIDLVLDRRRNNRSQIVFTKPNPGRANGRPMIFWQTARTAQRARPGQRIPTRRASELQQFSIDIDTRERYPLFPSRDGGTLTRDAIERRLAQHVKTAQQACPALRAKRITMHTMRHTAAMSLLTAGVDTSTIALWLGHEQERTTHIYLHADLELKQRTLDRITPPEGHPGR